MLFVLFVVTTSSGSSGTSGVYFFSVSSVSSVVLFLTTNFTNYTNPSWCSCYLLFLFLINGFHGFHGFFCVFCFFLTTNYTNYTNHLCCSCYLLFLFLNRRQRKKTQKLYMIVAVVISCFCAFLRLLWLILVVHPGTRTWCHAFPWWALCCSLSSRTASSRKQKYLDYDYVFPPMESNHRKGHAGRGVG